MIVVWTKVFAEEVVWRDQILNVESQTYGFKRVEPAYFSDGVGVGVQKKGVNVDF